MINNNKQLQEFINKICAFSPYYSTVMGNCLPKSLFSLPNIRIRIRSTCCSTNVNTVEENKDVTDGDVPEQRYNTRCCLCFYI